MNTSVRPFATPPEPDDGIHQPREREVLCERHLRPTWRRDGLCDIDLDEAS